MNCPNCKILMVRDPSGRLRCPCCGSIIGADTAKLFLESAAGNKAQEKPVSVPAVSHPAQEVWPI